MATEISPSLNLELISGPALPPISRPLSMQGAHTYAALWPYVRHANTKRPVKRQLVFVRDDGVLHLPGDNQPIAPARLPSSLPHNLPVPEDRLWSAAGVQRYLAGQRPDPVDVFQRLTRVLAHFVDFAASLAARPDVIEFFAAYILSTWFTPAFPVLPLLWITGDRGSGKSRLLGLLAQFAHLGVLLPALPPFEPLCALAGLGAALALDDAHAFTASETGAASWPRRGPHAILIAGRQRGPLLPLAGLGPRDPPRQLDVYGPRLFASPRPPHSALAGYCLVTTLYRSVDTALMARDPLDPAAWSAAGLDDPRALIDDLWALALSRLSDLPPHLSLLLARASSSDLRLATSSASDIPLPTSHLSLPIGAAFQPWHAILALASWLSSQPLQPPTPPDRSASPASSSSPTSDLLPPTSALPPPTSHLSPPTSDVRPLTPGLLTRLAELAGNSHSAAGTPDTAALALQGIFSLAVLADLVRRQDRAVAAGRVSAADDSNDGNDADNDGNDDGNNEEIGQNDGNDGNDGGIDLRDLDDLGDTLPAAYFINAADLLQCMQSLAAAQDLELPKPGLTDVHVGRLLGHLGLRPHRTAQRRTWSVTAAQLVHLARAYNLPIPPTLAQALNHVIQKQAAQK